MGTINKTNPTLLAAGFLSTGCPRPPAPPKPPRVIRKNLTAQIEIMGARLVTSRYVSHDKPPVSGDIQEVLVKWRNKGPSPVGNVRAKIEVWDAKGNRLPDSTDQISIFVAKDKTVLLPAGREYDEPIGTGCKLLVSGKKAARVKVTATYADDSTMKEYRTPEYFTHEITYP